ncbi:MAG TPA: hypothetical protein VFY45_23475 [Baekduia sp.]|nr:hypothetical protein [Baekduia sp.]
MAPDGREGRLPRRQLAGRQATGDRCARLAVGQPGVARGLKQRFGELVRFTQAEPASWPSRNAARLSVVLRVPEAAVRTASSSPASAARA